MPLVPLQKFVLPHIFACVVIQLSTQSVSSLMLSTRLFLLSLTLAFAAPHLFGQGTPIFSSEETETKTEAELKAEAKAEMETEVNRIDADKPTLEQILPYFRQNKLKLAEQLLLRSLSRETDSLQIAATHAWLAATYKYLRLNMTEWNGLTRKEYVKEVERLTNRSLDEIETALRYDDCNSMALALLADSYNPQLSLSARADRDLSWEYMLRAVQCDSNQGNAWMAIVFEAMNRGNIEMEQRAYQRLAESGFLPKPYLDYCRWMLQTVPDDAILFADGDMDTYSLCGLQASEKLRNDVGVISIPMLDLQWYAEEISERYRLPLPDSLLEAIGATLPEDESGIFTSGETILEWWGKQAQLNQIDRPLTAVLNAHLPQKFFNSDVIYFATYMLFADSTWAAHHRNDLLFYDRFNSHSPRYSINRPSINAFFDSLKQNSLVGPIVSDSDYSAIRSTGFGMPSRTMQSIGGYAYLLLERSDLAVDSAKAREILLFAEEELKAMRAFLWYPEVIDSYDKAIERYRSLRHSITGKEQ